MRYFNFLYWVYTGDIGTAYSPYALPVVMSPLLDNLKNCSHYVLLLDSKSETLEIYIPYRIMVIQYKMYCVLNCANSLDKVVRWEASKKI